MLYKRQASDHPIISPPTNIAAFQTKRKRRIGRGTFQDEAPWIDGDRGGDTHREPGGRVSLYRPDFTLFL